MEHGRHGAGAAVLARDRVGREPAGAHDGGTLTAETLTKAYLARIALTNAEGPAIQAVRAVNGDAVSEAKALDRERATKGPRGPLHGIPVLLDDSIDVEGLPTTGGSIALQESMPDDDATLVAKLKAAGAIILGKTNVTELNGLFDANMPEGYSSLGGQVLLPSDTDKTPAGSSAARRPRRRPGLAALTVGLETSTDTAQLIAPGRRRRRRRPQADGRAVSAATGVLPVAKSQDSPGPITRTVYDAALQLQAIAGADPADPATAGAPAAPDYLAGPRADRAQRQARRGDQQHDGAVPGRGHRDPGARRDDRRQDGRHAEPEPAEHRHARVQA